MCHRNHRTPGASPDYFACIEDHQLHTTLGSPTRGLSFTFLRGSGHHAETEPLANTCERDGSECSVYGVAMRPSLLFMPLSEAIQRDFTCS